MFSSLRCQLSSLENDRCMVANIHTKATDPSEGFRRGSFPFSLCFNRMGRDRMLFA